MKIINLPAHTTFKQVNPGDIFRLEKGSTLYIKAANYGNVGSNAVSIENGNKQSIDQNKAVVLIQRAPQ